MIDYENIMENVEGYGIIQKDTDKVSPEILPTVSINSKEQTFVNLIQDYSKEQTFAELTPYDSNLYENFSIGLASGELDITPKLGDISVSENVVKNFNDFRKIMHKNLSLIPREYRIQNRMLPKMTVRKEDDDSLTVDWKSRNYLIGFNIENSRDACGWYLVANEKYKELSISGKLFNNLEHDLLDLYIFALRNE